MTDTRTLLAHRAALRRDFEATHLDACAFVRYPGTHDQPPDPCTCGRDDVLALLDALDAAEAREAALRELVDSLWKSQHQYHGGSRKSCRFEWCQHIVAALAVEP